VFSSILDLEKSGRFNSAVELNGYGCMISKGSSYGKRLSSVKIQAGQLSLRGIRHDSLHLITSTSSQGDFLSRGRGQKLTESRLFSQQVWRFEDNPLNGGLAS
jgi:hypothetical protein